LPSYRVPNGNLTSRQPGNVIPGSLALFQHVTVTCLTSPSSPP